MSVRLLANSLDGHAPFGYFFFNHTPKAIKYAEPALPRIREEEISRGPTGATHRPFDHPSGIRERNAAQAHKGQSP